MLETRKEELHLLVLCLSVPQLDNLVDSALPLKLAQKKKRFVKKKHPGKKDILEYKCLHINNFKEKLSYLSPVAEMKFLIYPHRT